MSARTVSLDCEDHYASDWARHEPRGQGGAAEPYRVIGVRGTASPDRFWRLFWAYFGPLPLRTLVTDVRPPRTPTLLAATPPAPCPCPPCLHAHLSSRTHHESAAAPSCLFWLVPDACFHTGATSAARSQAMLAGLVPLCNWGRSHIRPTQRPKHARHGARHGAQRRPNTGPTAHTCLEHTPCWAHSARGK